MQKDSTRPVKPIDNFNRLIQSQGMQKYLLSTLHDRRDQFLANVTALVGGSPQLQACDPAAVIMTAVKATALNLPLDPSLGFAYVVPYESKSGYLVPQFQIGYKGYIQLALRTGSIKTINARDVREGEIVGEDYLSGDMTFQSAPDRMSRPVVGYVSYLELINGFRKSLYMSRADIEAHALRFSKAYKIKSGVWATNFDAMAIKTVLKLLLGRYVPMSAEMADGLLADGRSYQPGAEPVYIDSTTDQVVETASRDIAAEIMSQDKPEEGQAEEHVQEV